MEGEFFSVLVQAETSLLLTGPHPHKNPVLRFDGDASGSVVPLDVLIVINWLNAGRDGPLTVPASPADAPPPYVDVSGNDNAEPLDVLQIINYINGQLAADGEGEAVSRGGIGENSKAADVVPFLPACSNSADFGAGSASVAESRTVSGYRGERGLLPDSPAPIPPAQAAGSSPSSRATSTRGPEPWSVWDDAFLDEQDWGSLLENIASDVSASWAF